MEEYCIRYANKGDIADIMRFIDENWKQGHILSNNRELFEWQYVTKEKVNMIIGINPSKEIDAILGFIPYSNDDEKDFSLALWKAKYGTSFLGVKLLMYLLKEEPHRHVFCNGINVKTSVGIYHRLNIKTDQLSQWYRLRNISDYKIAEIKDRNIPSIQKDFGYTLKKVFDIEMLENLSSPRLFKKESSPYKSRKYISHRYFTHPIYKYDVYVITKDEQLADAAIVVRIQECNNSRVMRVIDVLGDYGELAYITDELDYLAKKYDAEYMDIYEYGIDKKLMSEAGWIEVGTNENVIPNYFAPYFPCNITINISTSDENIVLFKGDGDQDRPN